MSVKLSFIVSAYDRPVCLRCVLASLQVQTEAAIEIYVADNSPDVHMNLTNLEILSHLNDNRFKYTNPRERTCYEATKILAPLCRGEWLCFPHDDGYYVPGFVERMLRCAAANPSADFVYCDMIYDPRLSGGQDQWTVFTTSARAGFIDKGGFIIRKSLFLTVDWPPAPNDVARDGLFVDELVRRGVVTAKAGGVMWVHN